MPLPRRWLHNKVDWRSWGLICGENTEYCCDEDTMYWSRQGCGDAAIEAGNVELFEWIHAHSFCHGGAGTWFHCRALSCAARNGQKEMIQHLMQTHGCFFSPDSDEEKCDAHSNTRCVCFRTLARNASVCRPCDAQCPQHAACRDRVGSSV